MEQKSFKATDSGSKLESKFFLGKSLILVILLWFHLTPPREFDDAQKEIPMDNILKHMSGDDVGRFLHVFISGNFTNIVQS